MDHTEEKSMYSRGQEAGNLEPKEVAAEEFARQMCLLEGVDQQEFYEGFRDSCLERFLKRMNGVLKTLPMHDLLRCIAAIDSIVILAQMSSGL